LIISLVLPDMLKSFYDENWEEVSGHLQSPVEQSGGRYRLEDVFHSIYNGDYHLWIVLDEKIVAAAVTGFTDYPRKRMLTCHFLGGSRMDEWVEDMDVIFEKWARDHGASGIELTGRKGWGRALDKLGWKQSFFVTEKNYE
tara:strand:- start:77 stop:499 length:423 start_codon:yes stop_codon:yes gene_type:complete